MIGEQRGRRPVHLGRAQGHRRADRDRTREAEGDRRFRPEALESAPDPARRPDEGDREEDHDDGRRGERRHASGGPEHAPEDVLDRQEQVGVEHGIEGTADRFQARHVGELQDDDEREAEADQRRGGSGHPAAREREQREDADGLHRHGRKGGDREIRQPVRQHQGGEDQEGRGNEAPPATGRLAGCRHLGHYPGRPDFRHDTPMPRPRFPVSGFGRFIAFAGLVALAGLTLDAAEVLGLLRRADPRLLALGSGSSSFRSSGRDPLVVHRPPARRRVAHRNRHPRILPRELPEPGRARGVVGDVVRAVRTEGRRDGVVRSVILERLAGQVAFLALTVAGLGLAGFAGGSRPPGATPSSAPSSPSRRDGGSPSPSPGATGRGASATPSPGSAPTSAVRSSAGPRRSSRAASASPSPRATSPPSPSRGPPSGLRCPSSAS